MLRFCLIAAAATSVASAAAMWPLERLFQRPYVWGTSPQKVKWSKKGHVLAFLWDESGHGFMDLYAYHPDSRRRVRLTDLANLHDPLHLTEAEKDDRRRLFLPPQTGLDSFALSPDGARAAFSYKGDLFIALTDASRPLLRLTRTRAAETSPAFSPDGTRLASLRGGQIVVQDLATGQLWQVTDIESGWSIQGYRWSPDGARFAYETVRDDERKQILPNYSGRFVAARPFTRSVAGDLPPELAAYTIPADGGEPVAMRNAKGRVYTTGAVWSPDSARLALLAEDASLRSARLYVFDPRTGASVTAVDESDPAWLFVPEFGWSPDGKWLWFTSERDGWAHLYKVAASGGKADQITRGAFEVRAERFTHEPQWIGEWIYFSSTEDSPSERHLYRVRPDGSGKQKLSVHAGLNDGLVSEDGRHIAWSRADLDNPFDLWVDGERVTTSPRPGFRDLPWPATEFVRFPSRSDGRTVHAKLLLPPGFSLDARPQKKWPCVFFIHGAGYATSVLKQWGSYNELRYVFNAYLASRGYLVMDLDYRGSSGYGRDWRTGVHLHMGGKDLGDVLGAVDYLGTLGAVDMNRLGIWGVSYGGFMTNMAMFLSPKTFKAGSSWAAVNDWENYNEGYSRERLGTPAEYPEAYRRSSPILFSRNLEGALLILHGMVDSNVLFQDAVQLTEKLVSEGKGFSHFFCPQEDHGFVRDETWIDACRRTAEWFDRHLR